MGALFAVLGVFGYALFVLAGGAGRTTLLRTELLRESRFGIIADAVPCESESFFTLLPFTERRMGVGVALAVLSLGCEDPGVAAILVLSRGCDVLPLLVGGD